MRLKIKHTIFACIGVAALCVVVGWSGIASQLSNGWEYRYFGRVAMKLPSGAKVTEQYELAGSPFVLVAEKGAQQLAVEVDAVVEDMEKSRRRRVDQKIELTNGVILVSTTLYGGYRLHGFFLAPDKALYATTSLVVELENLNLAIESFRVFGQSIHSRDSNKLPPSNSFALSTGYMTLEAGKQEERIVVRAEFSKYPNTRLKLVTHNVNNSGMNLLEDFEQLYPGVPEMDPLNDSGKMTRVLRKRKRDVSGIAMEEVVMGTRLRGKNHYQFILEQSRLSDPTLRPTFALEVDTEPRGSDFKSDEEALVFWDMLVDSVKPV